MYNIGIYDLSQSDIQLHVDAMMTINVYHHIF